MITCQEVVEFLMSYLNDELSKSEKDVFESHVNVCAECVRFIETYRQTVLLESAAFCDEHSGTPTIPESVVQSILAARRQFKQGDA